MQTDKLQWDPEELEALEGSTYCQLFHDCFRRAPVIFRRLSDDAVAALPFSQRTHEAKLSPHTTNKPTVVLNVRDNEL